MEFLPDLKILMETGFARKLITKGEGGEKEGELIGTSNLKVDFQESLDLGSAVIKNSPSVRSDFLYVVFILRLLIVGCYSWGKYNFFSS